MLICLRWFTQHSHLIRNTTMKSLLCPATIVWYLRLCTFLCFSAAARNTANYVYVSFVPLNIFTHFVEMSFFSSFACGFHSYSIAPSCAWCNFIIIFDCIVSNFTNKKRNTQKEPSTKEINFFPLQKHRNAINSVYWIKITRFFLFQLKFLKLVLHRDWSSHFFIFKYSIFQFPHLIPLNL